MSGTSLDGVDIVFASFCQNGANWSFKINYGETYSYTSKILNSLKHSQYLSGIELTMLNVEYGKFLGNLVNEFINKNNIVPDFIASHGYTVFHEPTKGFTLQIGSGAEIAAITGIKTICDFRTTDVALKGQGAPLVPIGDMLLFEKYVACLNLGGFSNISYEQNGTREAFDICPVNYVFNYLAEKLDKEFDKDGEIAQKGNVLPFLFDKLNSIEYYLQKPPKSLGREFVENNIFPLFKEDYYVQDIMRTYSEHSALQISLIINKLEKGEVLVTGGGAYNTFLIKKLKELTNSQIIIPDKGTIDFKEALLFAFLGVLRLENIPNCIKTVTGAERDNIGGAVYL